MFKFERSKQIHQEKIIFSNLIFEKKCSALIIKDMQIKTFVVLFLHYLDKIMSSRKTLEKLIH